MENEASDVQPKCQGPLQLLFPPFLMTSTTKQMRPNGVHVQCITLYGFPFKVSCHDLYSVSLLIFRLQIYLTGVRHTRPTLSEINVLVVGTLNRVATV